MENKYKSELIEALNTLDQYACLSTEDKEEGKEIQKAYDLIFDFIESRL